MCNASDSCRQIDGKSTVVDRETNKVLSFLCFGLQIFGLAECVCSLCLFKQVTMLSTCFLHFPVSFCTMINLSHP